MTPGIALSSDKSTLFYIDSNGNKTDFNLLNGNAAKVALNSNNLTVTQVTSVPSGGATVGIDLAKHIQVGFKDSNSKVYVVGSEDLDLGIAVQVHSTDLSRNSAYLANDGSNLVITEG